MTASGRRRGGGRTGRGEAIRRGASASPAKRSASSTRWLARQLKDPYVAAARKRGYRSRAAFKLAQMDDRLRFLKRGGRIVDLGAAPGGWTQVALERSRPGGRVVAVDVAPLDPLPGAIVLTGDCREPEVVEQIRAALGGPAHAVLSDMAAPATGHARTDHLRVMALAETALDVAEALLGPGGSFVAKVLQGGTEADLRHRLKQGFAQVRHLKPAASRAESAELYLVATGYRGSPAPLDTA